MNSAFSVQGVNQASSSNANCAIKASKRRPGTGFRMGQNTPLFEDSKENSHRCQDGVISPATPQMSATASSLSRTSSNGGHVERDACDGSGTPIYRPSSGCSGYSSTQGCGGESPQTATDRRVPPAQVGDQGSSILEKLTKRAPANTTSTETDSPTLRKHQSCDRFAKFQEENEESGNASTPIIFNTLQALKSTNNIQNTFSCVAKNASDSAITIAKRLAAALDGHYSMCHRATDGKGLLEQTNVDLQPYAQDTKCMILVVLDHHEEEENAWQKLNASRAAIIAKVVFVLVRSNSATESEGNNSTRRRTSNAMKMRKSRKPFSLPSLVYLDAWKVVSADVSSPRTPWIHIAPVPESLVLPEAVCKTVAHTSDVPIDTNTSSCASFYRGSGQSSSSMTGAKRGLDCESHTTSPAVPLRRASSCSADVNPRKLLKTSIQPNSLDDSNISKDDNGSCQLRRVSTHKPSSSLLYASLNGIHDFSKTRASYVAAQYGANIPRSEDHHFAHYDEDSGASVFGVLDGHGTDRCSKYAAYRLASYICSNLTRAGGEGQVEFALRHAFRKCDEEFAEIIAAEKEKYGIQRLVQTRGVINAGCCALVAVVKDGVLSVANAGDCRAVLATTDSQDVFATDPSKTVVGVCMSRDHNAANPEERALVTERCSDPLPFRLSSSDYRSGARGPSRIAGTLAVTRALGDVYLKHKNLSTLPYSLHVPYITSEPDITTRRLRQGDCYLVLASDGIWDNVASQDAVQEILVGSVRNGCGFGVPHSAGTDMGVGKEITDMIVGDREPTNAAERVIQASLKGAAAARGITLEQLAQIQRQDRRQVHDDCTALVIAFSHANKELARLGIGSSSQKSTLKDFWNGKQA